MNHSDDNQRLLALAESMSGIGRWRLDLATGRSLWSDAVYAMFGVDRETFDPLHENVLALCHPDDRAKILPDVASAKASKSGFEVEYRINRPDGEVRHLRSKAVIELGGDGIPVAVFGVIQDVTKHAHQLQSLEESAERYRLLSEDMASQVRLAEEQARRAKLAEQVSRLGHWRVDAATHEVTWSAQMYEIYSLDPSAPLDLAALMAMTEREDRLKGEERLRRVLTTGEGSESTLTRFRRESGELRYLRGSIAAEIAPDGSVQAAIGTVVDVTEFVNAQLAMEQSEARYRLLAENASDLVLQFEIDGRVVYASPSSARMTGHAPEDLLGRRWRELLHPDDTARVQAGIEAQATAGQVRRTEPLQYRFLHPDGRTLWFEGRPTLIFDSLSGRVTGFTSIIRDVTLRVSAEAELRRARAEAEAATAAKSDFLANMSHELRTPLTAILGFSRLIEEQPDLEPTTRGYLARVATGGQALLTTVNDILDFSKLEAGQVEIKPRPTSAAAVGREALGLFALQAADKGLRLDEAGLDDLPLLTLIDGGRVRQILLNLIGNAVKFTASGGVRLESVFEPAKGSLTFSIIDTGPGISRTGMKRLFQRFSQVDGSSTRTHGGTGLGLAICKGLAEAMGGQAGVESTVGQGSRFWFSIPAAVVEASAVAAPPTDAAPRILPGCRVLIADDNSANRTLVQALLRAFEVDIVEAGDGFEAVAAAMAAPFDVILMDLRMPGLDGAGAARRIRTEAGPNDATPIIAFSAGAVEETHAALFDDTVAKPVSAEQLLAAVARATDFAGAALAAI